MSILPNQTIDFSVPNPSQTANLSLPLYQGAGYRAGYHTWSLLQNGGFMKFNLHIQEAIDVDFSMKVAAALVNGKPDCPISIAVNEQFLVQGYRDTDANWHNVSWDISEKMLRKGDNEIRVTLDNNASTQFFIQDVSVGAELPAQTIDFSVPNPSQTDNLSLPLYQGAGYRADFKTWSLLVDGGFMKFNLRLANAVETKLTMTLCASLVNGKPDCPATITVNDQVLAHHNDTNDNFHPVSWDIAKGMLHQGDNEIRITLDNGASTQLFIQAVGVEGI